MESSCEKRAEVKGVTGKDFREMTCEKEEVN